MVYKPNYICDEIGIPYSHAPGNIGDIEIFKDENVLVINKKSGFTSESVFDDVKANYPSAGFIHRLDRNTDGVMIFSIDEVSNSNPTNTINISTINPDIYSNRPCPKGCSLSTGFVDNRNPNLRPKCC